MIIYFDMDGVLCDFKGEIARQFAVDFNSSMWEDILEASPRIYRDLQPNKQMIDCLKQFQHTSEVRILTAKPSLVNFEFAEQDKREWVVKYIGDIEIIVCEKAIDKQDYAVYNSQPNILIDDSERNIAQWRSKGGIGLLYNF